MDYHQKQLPLHCRVCGQRLVKRKEWYECKAFAADLHIAFPLTPLTDDPQVHPEHFCHCCHHSMQRVISARAGGVHHRCALTPFVWAVHTNEGWTISILLRNIMYNNLQVCEQFNVSAKGHARKHTVGRGHQPGLTPNKFHCASPLLQSSHMSPTHHWQAKTM